MEIKYNIHYATTPTVSVLNTGILLTFTDFCCKSWFNFLFLPERKLTTYWKLPKALFVVSSFTGFKSVRFLFPVILETMQYNILYTKLGFKKMSRNAVLSTFKWDFKHIMNNVCKYKLNRNQSYTCFHYISECSTVHSDNLHTKTQGS